MKQTIFKYTIELSDEPHDVPTVRLPLGAKILSVGNQNERLRLWALVDEAETETVEHKFKVIPTGGEASGAESLTFLGTVSFHRGAFIFHVFEQQEAV